MIVDDGNVDAVSCAFNAMPRALLVLVPPPMCSHVVTAIISIMVIVVVVVVIVICAVGDLTTAHFKIVLDDSARGTAA